MRRIATVRDLCNLAVYVNAGNDCAGMTFELVDDIDLSTVKNFTPIKYFCGTFDGGGHTIGNLRINSSDNGAGLFGFVNESGAIKNVKLSKINVGGGDNVGGLAGSNSGTISNCAANGTVGGKNNIGGFVGLNFNAIQYCLTSGTVSGKNNIGGFVGLNFSTIQNCTASGTVCGVELVGDFVGINNGCIG